VARGRDARAEVLGVPDPERRTRRTARGFIRRAVRGLSAVNEALGVQIYENPRSPDVPRRERHQAEVVTVGASVHAQSSARDRGLHTNVAGQRRAGRPVSP